MKRITILLIALTTVLTIARAQAAFERKDKQPKLTQEQRAQKNVDEIDKMVTLTADQKTKVKELAMIRIKKADAIREKYKGQADQKEAMKSELMPIKKEFKEGLRALLSKEQLLKLREARKAAKGKGKKSVEEE